MPLSLSLSLPFEGWKEGIQRKRERPDSFLLVTSADLDERLLCEAKQLPKSYFSSEFTL